MRVRLERRPPAVHGGAAAGIDLSASLNPLGASPAALAAARAADLSTYPEVDAGVLRKAAARRHGLDAELLVPVPGAAWGLWLCAAATLEPGDRCLALAPCFGEYRRCVEMTGAEYVELRSQPPAWDWDEGLLEAALAAGPAMCVLGNPANPTAVAMTAGRLRRLCEGYPATRFVVDEAFAAFAPPGTSLLDEGAPPANVVVVRSLTKELGLPGLRMGYLAASPQLAGPLAGVLPAWPLSAPALAAAVAGLADRAHVEAGSALARRQVRLLASALARAGARTYPSFANYLLADAPGAAAALAGHGVAVRDCASFGLPGYVRLAAPGPDRLAAVLDAIGRLDGLA